MEMAFLERWGMLDPGMRFTVDLNSGEERIFLARNEEDGAFAPEGHLAFRSRVVKTIAEDLGLSPESLFLDELCAKLKIGPRFSEEDATVALDVQTLKEVLALVRDYRCERTALTSLIATSESLQTMAALPGLIAKADRALLHRLHHECVLAEQNAAAQPFTKFFKQTIGEVEHTQAVSNVMAMVSTIAGHAGYERSALTAFLESHLDAFEKRVTALMQRDQVSPKAYSKCCACVVEALDGLMAEMQIMNHPTTPKAHLQKELLEKLAIRSKTLMAQELSPYLVEVMRQQIVMGNEGVLRTYQTGFKAEGQITVPYPFDQGEQHLVATSTQWQTMERAFRRGLSEVMAEKSFETALTYECEVQSNDLKRGMVLVLGEERLPKKMSPQEMRTRLNNFFDVRHYPENQPLVMACAALFQQRGFIIARTHPLGEGNAMLMHYVQDSTFPSSASKQTLRVVREEDGFRMEVDERSVAPQRIMGGLGMLEMLPLNGLDTQNYIHTRVTVHVTLAEEGVHLEVRNPPEVQYRLQHLTLTTSPESIIMEIMARPHFLEKAAQTIKRLRPVSSENEVVQPRYTEAALKGVLAEKKEALAKKVAQKEQFQINGVPNEETLIYLCAIELLHELEAIEM